MERLIEYLSSVFEGVAETPEVLRAKAELMQMMEDKYEALLDEGKSEDEAVQTVIDEFGNIDEIIRELGLDVALVKVKHDRKRADRERSEAAGSAAGAGYTADGATGAEGGSTGYTAGSAAGSGSTAEKVKNRPFYKWSSKETGDYISFAKSHAFCVAAGVALCILAPYLAAICDDVIGAILGGRIGDGLSGLAFFLSVGLAVGLFITASNKTKRVGRIKRSYISVDEAGSAILSGDGEKLVSGQSGLLVLGIVLCVISPAVSATGDMLPGVLGDIFEPGILLFVALGVFCIIYSQSCKNRMKELSKAMGRYDRDSVSIDGGQASEWKYNDKGSGRSVVGIIAIVIVCWLAFMIVGNIFRGIGFVASWPFKNIGNIIESASPYDGKEVYNISDLDSLFMDISAADVKVIRGNDPTKLEIEYSGSFYGRPVFELSEKKLTVKDKTGFHLFGSMGAGGSFTVRVPEGSTKLSYEFDMSAGNLDVGNLSAQELKADMSAGGFKLHDSEIASKLDIDMSAGDATIERIDVRQVIADMSAGSFKYRFRTPDDAKKFSFDLDSSAGSITLMGDDCGDEVSRGAVTPDTPERSMKVDLSAGDIVIE
ncbi:MAG TPA: hypothetical protein DCP06_00360 [Lachnospiraceae bacterium]|nr:hypothetical protein [Lachnospiraceae bacterium]